LPIIIHHSYKVKEYFLAFCRYYYCRKENGKVPEQNSNPGGKAMKMSNEEYKKYAEKRVPRSSVRLDTLKAFVSGGAICLVGQFFLNTYLAAGLDRDSAAAACSLSLIFLGVLLTGIGVYDDIAGFAGAGSLVPITGFANSVSAPALEFRTEGLVLGTAVKMFSIAGPVIVYGISASIVYGLILVLTAAI
jgi:stage V sporulation protein AC